MKFIMVKRGNFPFLIQVLVCGTILLKVSAQGVDYSCALKWVAEGFGNVPDHAVSPGPGEFVAKVHLIASNTWRLGRLLPKEGKAHVAILVDTGEHTVFESETYEVLTNPDNCIVEWLSEFGGKVPSYAIAADEKRTEYVARGPIAGYIMTGTMRQVDSALFIAYEGQVYSRREYEVLTSRYPQLNMEVSDFYFPILDFRVLDAKSKDVLIGQMELITATNVNSAASNNVQITQPITHNKILKEVFKFGEKFNWEGVANISMEMDLWVGSPTVEATFQSLHPKDIELVYKRSREINVGRTVTISTGSGMTSSATSSAHQVCSVVTMLDDFGVKFEAKARVSAPNMRTDQVKEILLRTGRNLLSIDETDGTVVAGIFGTLRGNFALKTASVYSPVDEHGACNSVLRRHK